MTRLPAPPRAAPRASRAALLAGLLALAALVAAGAPPSPAAAQQSEAAAEKPAGPRFAFAPVEGGALKLDTQTGKVSLCTKGPAGFACEAVPDSRDAYEAEIARLQDEITTLKRGDPAAPGRRPEAAPGAPADLDTALEYIERFYRHLRGVIENLRAPDQSERL